MAQVGRQWRPKWWYRCVKCGHKLYRTEFTAASRGCSKCGNWRMDKIET